LPERTRAFTSASTTKAFSVPRLWARRLIAGMALLCRPMLINCVAYQVGLKDPTEEELEEMREEFGLHELAVEDARHGHQRPKIEEYGDSLFVVLNTLEIAGDEVRLGEVDVFVGR